MKRQLATLAIVLAIALAAALSFTVAGGRCTPVVGADEVSISAARLAPGSGHAFCYTDRAGQKIRFVLARGGDGKVHSVFDACRQCYKYQKGYAISGGDLVCRVCGNRYRIDKMLKGKASCVPVGLPHREQSGRVEVRVADLLAGRWLF